jgi:hypothetical protein
MALYDFGDSVRTTTSPAKEDERDLSKLTLHFPMFEALVRGHLASAGAFLTRAEKQHLAFSGKLIFRNWHSVPSAISCRAIPISRFIAKQGRRL